MKQIWDGKGAFGELTHVFFTNNAGVLVGRPELRRRVRKWLVAYWAYLPADKRAERVKETLECTVDRDDWLRPLNAQLVASVARAAKQWWYDNGERGTLT